MIKRGLFGIWVWVCVCVYEVVDREGGNNVNITCYEYLVLLFYIQRSIFSIYFIVVFVSKWDNKWNKETKTFNEAKLNENQDIKGTFLVVCAVVKEEIKCDLYSFGISFCKLYYVS